MKKKTKNEPPPLPTIDYSKSPWEQHENGGKK